MSELLTLSLRLNPATLQRSLILVACMYDIVLSVTIGEGWNLEGMVNRELRLAAQLFPCPNCPVHHLLKHRPCPKPPVHLLSHPPVTCGQDPEILELHWLVIQIQKAHTDWMGKVLNCPWQLSEGKELLHRSTAGAKTALLLPNLHLDKQLKPPLRHHRVNSPRETKWCDTSIIGAITSSLPFKNGNHHPSLPCLRLCSRPSHHNVKTCQSRRPPRPST